jgi:hypothetical protein
LPTQAQQDRRVLQYREENEPAAKHQKALIEAAGS